MPITLKKMTANTAPLAIAWGDETVNITYYPGRVTERTLAQIESMGNLTGDNAVAGFETFNAALANLLKSWDIYDDEEQSQVLPLTADSFSMLPFGFRVQLVQAIVGDIRPEVVAPQTTWRPGN